GEKVSFAATSGSESIAFEREGPSEGAEQPMEASAPDKHKPIQYDGSWKKPNNPYRSVFDSLLEDTDLPQVLLNEFYKYPYSLRLTYRAAPDGDSDFQSSGHAQAYASTGFDFEPLFTYRKSEFYHTAYRFLDTKEPVNLWVNPAGVTNDSGSLTPLGMALILIHECCHAWAFTRLPKQLWDDYRQNYSGQGEEGEQPILQMVPTIQELLTQYASEHGLPLQQNEVFTGTEPTPWSTPRATLLSYYGLFGTSPEADYISGRAYVNDYSVTAFGKDLFAGDSEMEVTDSNRADFNARLGELQARLNQITRN
ncbi:MAG: hypothetical protein AAFQ98_21175, partial [Bacteroidota bacterium]